MKKRDWVKLLERNGWKFVRHGGNHDIYTKRSEEHTSELQSPS